MTTLPQLQDALLEAQGVLAATTATHATMVADYRAAHAEMIRILKLKATARGAMQNAWRRVDQLSGLIAKEEAKR